MSGTVEDGWHKTIVTVAVDGTKKTRKVRTDQYGRGSQWRVRWDLPMGPDGKRRQRVKRGFTTKGEAQKFLREVLAEQDQGRPVERVAETVAEACEGFLATKRATGRAESTTELWSGLLNQHVIPRLGAVRVEALTPAQVEAVYLVTAAHGRTVRHKGGGVCSTAGVTCDQHDRCSVEMHGPLGASSLRSLNLALSGALRRAMGERAFLPTDAKRVKDALPKQGPVRVGRDDYWTDEQARQFIAATKGDRLGAMWALALATGLRRGELAGLQWSDLTLDGDAPRLAVRRTVVATKGGKKVKLAGKTDAAMRDVPLGAGIVAVLRDHWRAQRAAQLAAANWTDSGHVFTADGGEVLHPSVITHRFKAAEAAAGMPPVGLHGARHYAVTAMLRRGVPVTTVAKVVGHAKPSVTFDVYAHAIPDDTALVAAALDAALGTSAA